MTRRSNIRARLLVAALALVAIAALLTFTVLSAFAPDVPLYIGLLAYVAVGGLLALLRPHHPVGWLLLMFGVLIEITGAAQGFSRSVLARSEDPTSLGAEVALLALLGFGWMPALACLVFAIMLFPNGRLPSPRWRLPASAVLAAGAVGLAGALFGEQQLSTPGSTVSVPNPLAVGGLVGELLDDAFRSPLLAVIYLVPAAALLSRFRSARGVERQQLKLFAYTSSILLAVEFAGATGIAKLNSVTGAIALDLIPVAVAIAILRYRLYDIDVVIERTIVYGTVTALLGATYLASVVGTQALLGPITAGNEIAVAASTLLVIALFQPFRTRIREAVDRRFYRARYDAQHTLDTFGTRLRDEVDLDMLQHDLLGVVDDTMRPSRISLWLRKPSVGGSTP